MEASFSDGTSNTLLLAERYRTCQGYATAWGYRSFRQNAKDEVYGPVFDIGEAFQIAPTDAKCSPGVPQTPHTGGMPACLGDGSVRMLSAGVNTARSSTGITVFQALLTPHGGEVANVD